MSEEDRELRTRTRPLPDSMLDLVELFRRVMGLPYVQSVSVDTNTVTVSRYILEGEDVVPPPLSIAELDGAFVLGRLNLVPLDFVPDEHAYFRLVRACQAITDQKRVVVALMAPNPDLFSAFLGLEQNVRTGQAVLGHTVLYFGHGYDKFVVVGGRGPDPRDADIGIVVDMGD